MMPKFWSISVLSASPLVTVDKSAAPLVGIHTDDIVKAEQAVIAAGGTITRKTYDFPGGKRFYFREPSGSEMMVYMDV